MSSDSSIDVDVGEDLLEKLLGLFLRIKGFSYAKDIKEKHKPSANTSKKRSLRTELKKALIVASELPLYHKIDCPVQDVQFLKTFKTRSDFLNSALNTAIFNNKSDGSACDKKIRHFY